MERFFFIRLFHIPSVQAGILALLCSVGEMLFLALVRNMLTTLALSEALFAALPTFVPKRGMSEVPNGLGWGSSGRSSNRAVGM